MSIVMSLSHPKDIKRFGLLENLEHTSMHKDLPSFFWERAEDYTVFDAYRNSWIDFTSAVAVANSGHANKYVSSALREVLNNKLYTTFTFAHKYRLDLSQKIHDLLLQTLKTDYKSHFLCSGAEAVECAIDLAVEYKLKETSIIVSFINDFHGNTMQADALSGSSIHTTIINDKRTIHYLKLPFVSRNSKKKISFGTELNSCLSKLGLKIEDVITVLFEPYQCRGVFVADYDILHEIDQFCKLNEALMIIDEIQSGFYRTGKRFCFEYYGLTPDIICLGKGLSSSLPLFAVIAKNEVFDKTSNFEVLTTHSANPVRCAAAIANISYLESADFQSHLNHIIVAFDEEISRLYRVNKKIDYIEHLGMVAGLHVTDGKEPSSNTAKKIVNECFKKGLLINAPNCKYESYLRLTPPLTISIEALREGFKILNSTLQLL